MWSTRSTEATTGSTDANPVTARFQDDNDQLFIVALATTFLEGTGVRMGRTSWCLNADVLGGETGRTIGVRRDGQSG